MFTNQMRMTGFSGIDVADMVSQMMRAESARLNRLTGQRQIFAWQQEQMRSISTNLTNFRRDWTDITLMNSDRGIANPNNFVSASATLSGGSGNGINVTPVSGARNGVHTLEVNRIATADVFRSTSNVNTGAVSQGLDFDRLLNDDGEFRNFSFSVNVNGTARTISFTAAEMESFVGAGGDPVADFDLDAFADAIDAQLATAFPVGGGQRVSASVNGDGRLVIEAAQGNNVTLGGNITMLGIQAGNVGLNTQMSLGQFLGLGAGETTTITLGQANRANDAYRSFGADDTIQDVMNWINGSNIDARISFSQSTGLFTMEGTRTGEGNAITFSSSGDADFFARAGFVDIPAVVDGDGVVTSPAISTQITEAGNAEFLLNGTLMSRETNNFTESDLGLNIQLTSAAETAGEVTITVAADTSATRTLIEEFVADFNRLMASIQDLAMTARPRQTGSRDFFQPLTDEQRRAMSDREVEMWEAQARTGLLNRDNNLLRLRDDLRSVLYQGVEMPDGTTMTLPAHIFRLSTGGDNRGMLEIVNDDGRFDTWLEENVDTIPAFFSGIGTANQDGLRGHINEVINEYTGFRGVLTLAAGAPGSNTDTQSRLAQRISDQDRRIDAMRTWLERRESQLFAQFSRMEQAMMQAQQQMTFWDQIMWGGM